MKITFGNLLSLIPETQEVMIFEGNLQLRACWLCDNVLNLEVENIEAEKDLLKVWLKGV